MKSKAFGGVSIPAFGYKNRNPVRGKLVDPTIDFTAADLDGRVFLTAPPHTYIDQSGAYRTTKANEWPLQFLDGEVYGRHPPEKASVNMIYDSYFESVALSQDDSKRWNCTGGNDTLRHFAPTMQFYIWRVLSESFNYAAAKDSSTGRYVTSLTNIGNGSAWEWIKLPLIATTESPCYIYPVRNSDSANLRAVSEKLSPGEYCLSYLHSYTAKYANVGLVQVEPGNIRTSPIINGTDEINTRSEMTACIHEPAADSATIFYSNGGSVDVPCIDGKITIPQSEDDWRTKMITFVQLWRDEE